MKNDGGWAYATGVTLILAAPLVAFLAGNEYPLVSLEAGLLLAACVAAGLLMQRVAAALGPAAAALLLAGAMALALDLLYGPSPRTLAVLAVLCFVAVRMLGRHAAPVATAAAAVFLAATLLIPGTAADERTRALQAENDQLPVVLHVILDEHIGIDGLPAELAPSADLGRWLSAAYVQQGFRVYSGAYSQYFLTRHSIANLLNFTSGEQAWPHLAEGRTKPYVLTDSAYFRYLSALGYRLHVHQSDYMDYCRVPGVSYAACSRYRANSIGALRDAPLDALERAQFILNSLAATSGYLALLGKVHEELTGSPWARPVSRVGPLPVLPVLKALEAELRSARRGHAYFAHLLIPHYPYVLDESCRVRGEIEEWLSNVPPTAAHHHPVQNSAASRAERYGRYFDQVRCQQALLGRLFEAMKAADVWRDAIVVVHGDHGSRIVQNMPSAGNAARLTRGDFNDAFSTLFAVRAPGLEAGLVEGQRPLQELLGEAFGLPVRRLSPRVYLATDDMRTLVPRDIALFPRTSPH
jgi:hypothetical protein